MATDTDALLNMATTLLSSIEHVEMLREDKYDCVFTEGGDVIQPSWKRGGRPHELNKFWNLIHDEVQKTKERYYSHTENEYRLMCSDFFEQMKDKTKEIAIAKKSVRDHIIRVSKLEEENKTLTNELTKTKEHNRDLKRTADKVTRYKEEFATLSKKLRSIEEYVACEESFVRERVSVDEYFDTDPDLRMFFKLE